MTTIPATWLQEKVSLEAIEAKLKQHTDHPEWQTR
jgi:hypothetical protein